VFVDLFFFFFWPGFQLSPDLSFLFLLQTLTLHLLNNSRPFQLIYIYIYIYIHVPYILEVSLKHIVNRYEDLYALYCIYCDWYDQLNIPVTANSTDLKQLALSAAGGDLLFYIFLFRC